MKLSKEVIEQIPILYKELGVKTKVAEQLGISVSSVNKYLTIYGAVPPEEKIKRTVVTEEMIKEINDLYSQYHSLAQVSRELGICTSTVKRYLTEENLKVKDTINDDRDALFYYILKLFGVCSEEQPVSEWNIIQMQKFKNQGIPYRAQLLTLKYFYEVEHNSTKKSRGSIGIIPFVLERSKAYYERQAKKADEITAAIQRQLEKDRVEIKYNPSDYIGRKKKKKMINLEELV